MHTVVQENRIIPESMTMVFSYPLNENEKTLRLKLKKSIYNGNLAVPNITTYS